MVDLEYESIILSLETKIQLLKQEISYLKNQQRKISSQFDSEDPWPDCSEPREDGKWSPNINSMLRDIKRYRKQNSDPEGYKQELLDARKKVQQKKIQGSSEGGRNESKS